MKPFILILPALCSLHLCALASDPKFPVTEIPAQLTADADVVVRENSRTYTINARDNATYHVYQVITILNEQGKSYATEIVGYDKLTKIKDFKGAAYDASGKLLKRLKAAEIYDQSAFDGITLYSDNRLKAANLSQGSYPYTVEFEYDIAFKYLFQIPAFILIPGERVSVQEASYKLAFPPELKPKFKLLKVGQQPQMTKSDDGMESLEWSFQNVLPVRSEPYGPPEESIFPRILAAPSAFQYGDYVGSMNTWDEFGKWISALNKGRDQLPASTQQKLKSLTADLTTTEEKARAVYHFLQNRTRYVGIQLGIGGFQPFEASVVDETGYGDCKALSNYMVSMLKVVGVEAYYVLIEAGADAVPLKTDFVCAQFNHAVVAVPNGADTLWLECTSQTAPFGYAGRFTGDRDALLITGDGARIVHTPVYPAGGNLKTCTADVVMDISGNASASIKTAYHGLQYENGNVDAMVNDQYDDQRKWILKNTPVPVFDLVSFKVQHQKALVPSAFVELKLNLNRFATVSGKRIFLTPNLMSRNHFIPPPTEQRKSPVVMEIGYTNVDTIHYTLPEAIYPEFIPADVSINSRFGEYRASFKVASGELIYTRKVKINKGEFPPESYQELIDFCKSVGKADNTKMVFMNKT